MAHQGHLSSHCLLRFLTSITVILVVLGLVYVYSPRSSPVFPLSIISGAHRNRKSVKILCLILTIPSSFQTRARAINATWARRCDRFYFISEYLVNLMTFEEIHLARHLPIAPITNIKPGYHHLTQKTVLAFFFAYERHFNDFDWFVKADDDTYLSVEHLKHFLSDKNTWEPVTFGYNFKTFVRDGYHSGGASYVLSRESLRRFYQGHHNPNESFCPKDRGSEDIQIARCLRKQGVVPGRSLDEKNRELFHPLPFSHHFRGLFPDWIHYTAENPLKSNYECCGERSISFHYVSVDDLYMMEFLYLSSKRDFIED